jgi:hypothetical protein
MQAYLQNASAIVKTWAAVLPLRPGVTVMAQEFASDVDATAPWRKFCATAVMAQKFGPDDHPAIGVTGRVEVRFSAATARRREER